MIDRFEIIGHGSPRPHAERILFCDGTGGNIYCPETDLELSHWRPNHTPSEYRAGTSAEICFRFLDNPRAGNWTAAVNNHLDIDGILSVYVLVHSEHARANRQTIIAAAEMGDFWGWGELPAQRLFQGLTLLMDRRRQQSDPAKNIYEEAFHRVPGLIDGTDPQIAEIDESLSPLRHGEILVTEGRIVRSLISNRLAHYYVPLDVAGSDDARVSYVPGFNEAISAKAVLWPQVRARLDAQRMCLVSIERPGGWFHDLCFPGYLWADTEGLWKVPGLKFHNDMSSYEIRNERLIAAFQELQQLETGTGWWCLGGTDLPFGDELQKTFPIAGRFLGDEGRPTMSTLKPEQVAKVLATNFV